MNNVIETYTTTRGTLKRLPYVGYLFALGISVTTLEALLSQAPMILRLAVISCAVPFVYNLVLKRLRDMWGDSPAIKFAPYFAVGLVMRGYASFLGNDPDNYKSTTVLVLVCVAVVISLGAGLFLVFAKPKTDQEDAPSPSSGDGAAPQLLPGLIALGVAALVFSYIVFEAVQANQKREEILRGAIPVEDFIPDEQATDAQGNFDLDKYIAAKAGELESACKRNDGKSCNVLGNVAQQSKDFEKAAIFYKRACVLRFYDGCDNLGLMESNKGNDAEAVRLFQLSCDANNPGGCSYLGTYRYKDGRKAEAKVLAEKACNQNYSTGCYLLGMVEGEEGDFESARAHFRKGCDGGTLQSCHYLGVFEAHQGNIFEAKRMIKKACDGGYKPACEDANNPDLNYTKGNFAKLPAGSVSKQFQPYLKRFEKEAQLRNVTLGNRLSAVSIKFSFNLSDYNTLAQCDPSSLAIGVSESYWMTSSDPEREELMFHELGHCLLGREHEDSLMPISGGSVYGSIMNSKGNVLMSRFPNINNCVYNSNDCGSDLVFAPTSKSNFYNKFRKIYLDELFRTVAGEGRPARKSASDGRVSDKEKN